MRIRMVSSALTVSAVLLAQAACGNRPVFDGTVYKYGNVGFRIPPVPDAWKKIRVSDASLAYRDEAHDASILVNARCASLDQDTPLHALTSHLLIGTTEREVLEQAVEPFDDREAMHTRVTAKLDGVPRVFDVFVLKKDGCVYDLVFVAAPGSEDGISEFQTFARAFHTLPGTGAR